MAAGNLPTEVLAQVAGYLAVDRGPRERLGPCALVNKAWQSVFEAEIYASIWLRSPEITSSVIVGHEAPIPKRGLTIQQLDEIISGPGDWRRARRDAVRNIMYWVGVPHWLCDGLREQESEHPDRLYTYDNRFRRENDEAFSKNVVALFDYLSSPPWKQKSRPLILDIVLQAENVYTSDMPTEPNTYIMSLNETPLADYRANFALGTALCPTNIVRGVNFPTVHAPRAMGLQNGISLPSQIKILSACIPCPALTDVTLDGTYYVPIEDPTLYVSKRDTVASALATLVPSHIRTVTVKWGDLISPQHWAERTSIPLSVSLHPDTLSASFRNFSLNLRELHLSELDFTPSLFSLSPWSSQEISWPNLQVFTATSIPMAVPSGRPLTFSYHPNPGSSPVPVTYPAPSSGNPRVRYFSNQDGNLSVIATYFDDMFAAIGWAARRMPRLRKMEISYGNSGEVHGIEVMEVGKSKVLRFESHYGYAPTWEVLRAWGLNEQRMIFRADGLEGEFDTWPPLG